MGRGLENPRLITAMGRAAGGVKRVYSVLILILYMISFIVMVEVCPGGWLGEV